MNQDSDQQLLRDYAERRSQAAFAELVRRHIDFVYSTALRMVRNPQFAEDVTQSVFVALGQNALRLTERPTLSGWLHRTAQNIAAKAVRTEVRRRAREQESAAMNELRSAEADTAWEHIAPLLDAALGRLNDLDRDAVLLRYFQGKSAREIAQTLDLTEDAAQKRVSRALEKLRTHFTQRGVTVSAPVIVSALATHSVQAAPAGLSTAILTTAAASAVAVHNVGLMGGAKILAMTTTQKVLVAAITAGLAVTAGTSVYQTHQVSQVREQLVALRQQQEPLLQQVEQLRKEREEAQKQIGQLRRESADLPRLRGEVTRLQANAQELAQLKAPEVAGTRAVDTEKEIDPTESAARVWLAKVNQLKQRLEQVPDKKIPELQFLTENDWLTAAARYGHLETDDDFREAFRSLRDTAKKEFARKMGAALSGYALANGGQLPADVSQLAPYFQPPVDNAILQRYQVVHAGPLSEVSQEDLPVAEKAPVDDQYDTLLKIGPNGYRLQGTGSLSGMTGMGSWTSPAGINRSQGNIDFIRRSK